MNLNKTLVGTVCVMALSTIVHAQQNKPADQMVASANRAVQSQLPFDDQQDFKDAMRGFIATRPDPANPDRWAFLNNVAPPTANPSLWREAQLNTISGLFKIAPGVYQIRGYSPANMTIVEGSTGLIIIDALSTPGAAREALDLYFAHRPRRRVVALIYSHSHPDHYGGAGGVVSLRDVAVGTTKVIAPLGYTDALLGEAVIAGNARARRSQYQFGVNLPLGERGHIDNGLGKNFPRGTGGSGPIILPNEIIQHPIETRTIGGVRFIFELALDSEAPSEMLIYLPKSHVLDVAEDATHTLHNLLPFRGTVVRDANRWSQYLNVALDQFGADVQVVIAQHQWPVWGNSRVRAYLADQRDLYKFLHDQTIRMINQGLGPAEIAAAISMPPGLDKDWATRGYYGTLADGAKAVYQRYLGWFDGNPATLDRLPRVEEAKNYIEYMGGSAAVIARAREDFAAGHYRWVAEVMDQVVFADPSNKEARDLAADALEQLGYLAESALWRNAYLLGAQDLRTGISSGAHHVPGISVEVMHVMPIGPVFDYLGTRLDGPRAGTAKIVISWRFTDTGESIVSTLQHGALTAITRKSTTDAEATVITTRAAFERVILEKESLSDALKRRDIAVDGNDQLLADLFSLLVDFDPTFPIVEPGAAQTGR